MAQIKPTEKGQEERLNQLKSLRNRRKNIAETETLQNEPAWLKLVEVYKEFVVFAAREQKSAIASYVAGEIGLEEFGRLTIAATSKIANYGFSADIIKDRTSHLEGLDAEIARVEKAYKDAKDMI